ncbi:carbonic anhydrase/acetyltransferase-like protein (isoleucine patch superfamily) [Actinocorallia herbida]|uniref:Carbonic anhydrase/acetyltransferase-like protein (Isoleucine patch superfamily) n=1 Tax=Actinocorallia herbida TaxID=58109 RepID=A0A3N1D4M3_9ACTN|nr:gamma carbonic anhydrase family protein [Actinocorallia herbida]ROO88038.1 carbonic anhydrase/acetyltransferase-like protein (isoleucine patch superfamily) [Actinocorallia herbida]
MAIYALGTRIPEIDPRAYVHPDATVIGSVKIRAGASIWPGAVLRGDYGSIEIGESTSIQDGSVLHTTEEWPTLIGDRSVIGHNVHLEGCVIGDDCLIGSGSIILNRALVDSGGAVGAAALVPEDGRVPAGHIAVGVPARVRPAPRGLGSWISDAVALYEDNAERYRTGLRRLDE